MFFAEGTYAGGPTLFRGVEGLRKGAGITQYSGRNDDQVNPSGATECVGCLEGIIEIPAFKTV